MENAEWPTTSVPGPIKKLIARFYELVDSEAPDCSDILATEVFVPDGKFVINKREMMGTERRSNNATSTGSLYSVLLTSDRNQELESRRRRPRTPST